MLLNLSHRSLHGCQKAETQALPLVFEENSSIIQFKFGELMKAHSLVHEIRARASRKTSSASRIEAAPESRSASRRTASSAQRRSISSSERSSRLLSSFSASSA